jgi:hypothetical protein
VRLPTRAIPYGFAWIPLGITIVTYTWLFGSWYRGWLGPDGTRAVICVLFALAPLAQWHLLAHTDYSIWNTFLLLVFLTTMAWPATAWRRYAGWTAANVLVWSHPLTILVAPIVAYRLVRERDGRVLTALTLANLVLHQVAGVEDAGAFTGLSGAEVVAKLGRTLVNAALMVAATAYRTAFGPDAYGWAVENSQVPVAIFATALLAVSIVTARRSRRVRIVLGLLCYLVVTVTFLSVLVRESQVTDQLNSAQRYIYVPTLAFLTAYVVLLDYWLRDRSVETGGEASGSRLGTLRLVVLAGLLVWHVALNARMGHYFFATGAAARPAGGHRSRYVQAHPDNGIIVRDFFAELERAEERLGSRQGINLVANKFDDWAITIGERPSRRRR